MNNSSGKVVFVLLVLTLLAFLLQGYHPGVEDDAVYLSAIQHDLHPDLYPHDFEFFTLQLQATIFDKLVAASVRLSRLPVSAVALAWQLLTIFLILWGCWRISRLCFSEWYAQWAGVCAVAVLLTLPVAGTALYLVDQHLHPRAMATAAILAAIPAALEKRYWLVVACLGIAGVLHPIMAGFGISYCIFLLWRRKAPGGILAALLMLAAGPLNWIFEPTSPAWQQAAHTRDYFYLSAWHWYEWVGVFAPLLILAWFAWLGRRDGIPLLAHTSSRLVAYGIFQLAVALMMVLPPSLDRLKPLQPMRYLHLLYLIMVLLAGGLAGQRFLRTHWARWVVVFVPLSAGMFFAQRQTFPDLPHVEWPGAAPRNAWHQAFQWARQNTPGDSLFALGPYYMQRPREDSQSFRARAERSVLADLIKDASVATQVPRLAPRWLREVQAQQGWEHFQKADFDRLHSQFGVTWVILERPGVAGLACPYQNDVVLVCKTD